jgi:hypothetical protein
MQICYQTGQPGPETKIDDLTLHDVWQNAGEDGTDAPLKL